MRTLRERALGPLAAVAVAAAMVTAVAAPARATVTCPTVDQTTGQVTPAPSAGVDWQGCDLSHASMAQADLAGANLQGATLANAYMPNANLTGANLSNATMTSAEMAGGTFVNVLMTSSNLLGADLDSSNLRSAVLTGASAFGTHFIGDAFEGANLQNIDLSQADVTAANFFGASLQGATTQNTTWTDAICPNGASANYYVDGCLSAVAVTTPAATATITAGTQGKNGWYTSGVTVTWYWVDSQSLNTAECPASTTSSTLGAAVVISASCTDSVGNVGHGSLTVKIDTIPPTERLTGFREGGIYQLGLTPLAGCVTSDAISGVALNAGILIDGTRPDGTGVVTVTCSGGENNAGLVGPVVIGHYTVVYLFGGFISPRPGSTLSHSVRKINVRFRLAGANGTAIPATTQAQLAALFDVRATLRGPGISAKVATCAWNASGKYLQCAIIMPRHVATGPRHRYLITALVNVGSGFITVPPDASSQNPEPIHFS